MKRLRVGIIGLGRVSELHLQGYRGVDCVELVAGSDPESERVDETSARWGVRAYTDYQEMIGRERLDVAVICTPTATHREITEKVAEHGVHVLCEKPLALSVADAQAMVDKCQREHVKLYYGSTYRHLTAVRKAHELVTAGELGEVQLLLETVIGGSGLAAYKAKDSAHYPPGGPGGGGLGLVDHGIHLIDVFAWLTGSEVQSVFGRGNISGESPGPEYLTMCFQNGAVGQLLYLETTYPSDRPVEGIYSWGMSWDVGGRLSGGQQWVDYPGSFRVHGTKGSLRVYHYAQKLFFTGEGRREEVKLVDRPHPENFGLQMESFVSSILRDDEPEISGEDGVRALRVLLAAYESCETGKAVQVEELTEA